jgi:hypothetical protein
MSVKSTVTSTTAVALNRGHFLLIAFNTFCVSVPAPKISCFDRHDQYYCQYRASHQSPQTKQTLLDLAVRSKYPSFLISSST